MYSRNSSAAGLAACSSSLVNSGLSSWGFLLPCFLSSIAPAVLPGLTLLCAVVDAGEFNCVFLDGIDGDVGKPRKHKLACAFDPSFPSAIWQLS